MQEAPSAEIKLSGLPPSLWGAYYQRRGGVRKCLTEKASEWKYGAIIEARSTFRRKPFNGRLQVEVRFRAKSRGRWDIDNRFKVLLDAMTEAGVWTDDSKIDSLLGIVEIDGKIRSPETVLMVREVEVGPEIGERRKKLGKSNDGKLYGRKIQDQGPSADAGSRTV